MILQQSMYQIGLFRRVLIPGNVIYYYHEEYEGLEDISLLQHVFTCYDSESMLSIYI